jgi:DUF1009 family protein
MPAAEKSRVVRKVAVIAGGGNLPAQLIRACEQAGHEVFVVGFENQTDPAIFEGREHLYTRIGAAGQIMSTLRAHGFRDLVFIGSIRRPTIGELRPDFRTARFYARLGLRALGDNGLLSAMRKELESEGFSIHGVQEFASDLLAAEGALGKHRPRKKADWADIEAALRLSREMGRLDVGQAVIVQEGIVLGVEAIEGTDELLRRCAKYRRRGRGGVLVKSCKPAQDRDLDLPTIGPETVRLAAEAQLAGIVIEAGHSLIVDPETVAELANKAGLYVMAVDIDKVLKEAAQEE